MALRHATSGGQQSSATKERISACRKRLRQTRATQRALRIEQDEAVVAANTLLALVSRSVDPGGSEEIFEEAGATRLGTTPRLAPEVDRRLRLRAR
ncbi:MAG TPA: hypothetical protein VJT09_00960 [Pyrinomonadaceae bacterium]|nr:hypothetical protein [Pyrinomonadaceae bacterium]